MASMVAPTNGDHDPQGDSGGRARSRQSITGSESTNTAHNTSGEIQPPDDVVPSSRSSSTRVRPTSGEGAASAGMPAAVMTHDEPSRRIEIVRHRHEADRPPLQYAALPPGRGASDAAATAGSSAASYFTPHTVRQLLPQHPTQPQYSWQQQQSQQQQSQQQRHGLADGGAQATSYFPHPPTQQQLPFTTQLQQQSYASQQPPYAPSQGDDYFLTPAEPGLARDSRHRNSRRRDRDSRHRDTRAQRGEQYTGYDEYGGYHEQQQQQQHPHRPQPHPHGYPGPYGFYHHQQPPPQTFYPPAQLQTPRQWQSQQQPHMHPQQPYASHHRSPAQQLPPSQPASHASSTRRPDARPVEEQPAGATRAYKSLPRDFGMNREEGQGQEQEGHVTQSLPLHMGLLPLTPDSGLELVHEGPERHYLVAADQQQHQPHPLQYPPPQQPQQQQQRWPDPVWSDRRASLEGRAVSPGMGGTDRQGTQRRHSAGWLLSQRQGTQHSSFDDDIIPAAPTPRPISASAGGGAGGAMGASGSASDSWRPGPEVFPASSPAAAAAAVLGASGGTVSGSGGAVTSGSANPHNSSGSGFKTSSNNPDSGERIRAAPQHDPSFSISNPPGANRFVATAAGAPGPPGRPPPSSETDEETHHYLKPRDNGGNNGSGGAVQVFSDLANTQRTIVDLDQVAWQPQQPSPPQEGLGPSGASVSVTGGGNGVGASNNNSSHAAPGHDTAGRRPSTKRRPPRRKLRERQQEITPIDMDSNTMIAIQRYTASIKDLCILCYDQPNSTHFSCGHEVLCVACANTLVRSNGRCPICGVEVNSFVVHPSWRGQEIRVVGDEHAEAKSLGRRCFQTLCCCGCCPDDWCIARCLSGIRDRLLQISNCCWGQCDHLQQKMSRPLRLLTWPCCAAGLLCCLPCYLDYLWREDTVD